jgi:hypothetical protein
VFRPVRRARDGLRDGRADRAVALDAGLSQPRRSAVCVRGLKTWRQLGEGRGGAAWPEHALERALAGCVADARGYRLPGRVTAGVQVHVGVATRVGVPGGCAPARVGDCHRLAGLG